MPELPEVETVARQLAPALCGRRVRCLRILDPRLRDPSIPRLAGRRIEEVTRSGKQVLLQFARRSPRGFPVWLAIHLRMTGRLLWSAAAGPIPGEHLRARVELDRGTLLFYDARRFGTWKGYATAAETLPGGLDPLAPELTGARLRELVDGSRQNIKTWLLRQDRLVGLGNIYASEILHAASIAPAREAGSLDAAELDRVARVTRRILLRAIRNCGTTFSDFQDARGVTGSYQRFLRVYGREGEPCLRCGSPIERSVQQQRSTFHCPGCQR